MYNIVFDQKSEDNITFTVYNNIKNDLSSIFRIIPNTFTQYHHFSDPDKVQINWVYFFIDFY